jgi:NAD(P)-dependent dehydrogenase (short-subunit alcohol dehydrogenase family)
MDADRSFRTYEGSLSIVTGGASGIGRALAEELTKRGGEVVLADLQIDLAREVASDIQAGGGKATAVEVDVADSNGMRRLVQNTVRRTGRLDYMFNNAGIGVGGGLDLHRIDDWERIIDVNLKGTVWGTHWAYQSMLEQGFGHIVNTASMAAVMPTPGIASYGTTKHGILGLTRSMRAEAALKGIRVSVLCPGVIQTPLLMGGKYSRILVERDPNREREFWKKMKPMPADRFASKALDAVSRNKAIIVIPRRWKRIWWLNRLSPGLGITLSRRQYRRARDL